MVYLLNHRLVMLAMVFILLSFLAIALYVFGFVSKGCCNSMHMPYFHPMIHPFMGIGMGLLWLVLAIAVVYLIYKLIKSEKILALNRPVIRSTEDILSESYAKRELTREQYMQIKEDWFLAISCGCDGLFNSSGLSNQLSGLSG